MTLLSIYNQKILFDIISGLICTYEQKVFVIFKAARLQYFESASRPSAA